MRTNMTMEELMKVNGGFAVDGGKGRYYAVDDKTGEVYAECNISIKYAQWAAEMRDQSRFVITPEEYQRKFGKPLF